MHREQTECFPAGDARHPHFGMKFLIKSTTRLREVRHRRGMILRELLSQDLKAIRMKTNNRPASEAVDSSLSPHDVRLKIFFGIRADRSDNTICDDDG
jgi:hypothetical protein